MVTASPSFTLHEAKTREEVDALAPVVFAAFHDPYVSEYQFIHPLHAAPESDPAAALKASQDRRWADHSNNPASHWVYVREAGSGAVVGATQWLFFAENPFPNGPVRIPAPWWPPGEGREFTENIIAQVYKPRMIFMQRPHAALNSNAVLPAWRKRGVGALMMEWGVRQADQLGLECFIEASDSGRALYERYGLRVVFLIAVDTYKHNAGDAWRAYASQLGRPTRFVMWRPAGGVWTEGGPQGPWDVRTS